MAQLASAAWACRSFAGPSDAAESHATLERAAALGVTLIDTADVYGTGENESLLAPFLKAHRAVKIATKFGIVREPGRYERRLDNSPAYGAAACEASLKRLGVETIDLYHAHRVNPAQLIKATVGAMAALVKAGKVRAIGLCEVSAATLRRA